jgi:hypothetical protein
MRLHFGGIESIVTRLHPDLVDCHKAAMADEKECLHTTTEGTVKVTISIVVHNPPSLELQLEPAQ